MSDEHSADQLPLFGKHEIFVKPEIPATRWDRFGELVEPAPLVDLTGVHLHAVAPIEHRNLRARQDRQRDDMIRSLSDQSRFTLSKQDYHTEDQIWAAYACYSDGKTDFAIFEKFAEAFSQALKAGLLRVWLEKVNPSEKSKTTQGVFSPGTLRGLKTLQKAGWSRVGDLKIESGLSNFGGGVKATRNTRTLIRDSTKPRF